MYCIPKFCLIFCTIPIIKAVSLKIDGLINLGENWSYEYRVLRSGAKHSHHQNDNEAGRQTDEEQLRMLEERLRKEAAEYRKEVQQKDVEQHKQEKDRGLENAIITTTTNHVTVETHKTKASETFSGESGSSDSDSEQQKKATVMLFDDTTKMTKKILRSDSAKRDYSETQSQESSYTSDSSERSASWIDETRHAPEDESTASSHDSNINIINHEVNPRAPRGILLSNTLEKFQNKIIDLNSMVNKTTLSTSTRITTVRTEDIYTDPHKVKDDAKITEFTNHLYRQTLKVFDVVKQKTNQDHLKSQIDRLSRSYEVKFKEFLRGTSNQKIKTRLGTQKVILNTIDMSNRILRRLMNFMVGDLDKKGVFRQNAASANLFQKAIDTEHKLQLRHACKKFGICRSGDGYSAFLTKVLTAMLQCDDSKLKQTFDAFTEAIKNMNFLPGLQGHSQKKLDHLVRLTEMQDAITLRAVVKIIKNLITRQYEPLVVYGKGEHQSKVNSTLALLEIIDLLDTKIRRDESNTLEWADMKNSFDEFTAGKRHNILEIITAMAKNLKSNLKSLDEDSQKIFSKNLNLILATFDD